jgi:hypothetical protein
MDWDTCLRLDSSGACFAHIACPATSYFVNEGQITAPRELFASDRQAVGSSSIRGRRVKKPSRLLDAAYKLVSGADRCATDARSRPKVDETRRWTQGVFDLIRLCYAVDPAS